MSRVSLILHWCGQTFVEMIVILMSAIWDERGKP